MTIKDKQKLRDGIKESLTKTHRDGLMQGSKAMCSVILQKANDTKKSPDKRIEDIIRFCEVSLGKNK